MPETIANSRKLHNFPPGSGRGRIDRAVSILVEEGEGLLELWGKKGNESEVEDHKDILTSGCGTPSRRGAEGVSAPKRNQSETLVSVQAFGLGAQGRPRPAFGQQL